eukprot:2289744-Alexandrium_andersonii.AAC.1
MGQLGPRLCRQGLGQHGNLLTRGSGDHALVPTCARWPARPASDGGPSPPRDGHWLEGLWGAERMPAEGARAENWNLQYFHRVCSSRGSLIRSSKCHTLLKAGVPNLQTSEEEQLRGTRALREG